MEVYEKIRRLRRGDRPTAKDYIEEIFEQFTPLCGDRLFGEDPAVLGGIGWLCGKPVTVIGTDRGKDLAQRVERHFGSPLPEGYRKALRLMKQAEKFRRPVVLLVDTQGAYPGAEAEERGQGLAIAENLYEMMGLKTPILSVIIGEGGSSGALALSVADRVYMLEGAYYSVITPEACASILYKDPTRAPEAAEHLGLTAEELLQEGFIDGILPEGDLAKEEDRRYVMQEMKKLLSRSLREMGKLSLDKLLAARYERFRRVGRGEGKKKRVEK